MSKFSYSEGDEPGNGHRRKSVNEQHIERWLARLPLELTNRKQWILWKYVRVKGRDKPTKVLYTPDGIWADSTDPSTWSAFEDVVSTYESNPTRFDGIGFVFSENDPYCGIDLDECISNGVPNELAQSVITSLDSYTEYSPSGDGIHILAKGYIPGPRRKNSRKGIEMYDSKRFFTMSGDVYAGIAKEINERQDKVDDLYRATFLEPKAHTLKDSPRKKYEDKSSSKLPRPDLKGEDATVIATILNGVQSDKFLALYNGGWRDSNDYRRADGSPDNSAADLALCAILAYWTGRSIAQMDRIFRNSALMREKWDSPRGNTTYGEMTLSKAIENEDPWDSDWLAVTRQYIKEADFREFVKPNGVYRSSSIDKVIADAILDISELNKSRKVSFSYRTLSDKAGIGSLSTIQRSLRRLEGWFLKKASDSISGSQQYEIIIEPYRNIISSSNTCDNSVSIRDDSLFSKYKSADAFARGRSTYAKANNLFEKSLNKNALLVMDVLATNKPLNRKHIQGLTGLSEKSVKNATLRLENLELVYAEGKPKRYGLYEDYVERLELLKTNLTTHNIGSERQLKHLDEDIANLEYRYRQRAEGASHHEQYRLNRKKDKRVSLLKAQQDLYLNTTARARPLRLL